MSCYNTGIKEIPKELVSLVEIRVNNMILKVPKELINIKIIKLQRYIKLYIKLPILWKIAEYYTKKKLSPENVLKYINLED